MDLLPLKVLEPSTFRDYFHQDLVQRLHDSFWALAAEYIASSTYVHQVPSVLTPQLQYLDKLPFE